MKKEDVAIEFKGFLSFLILHELKQRSLCGDDLAQKIGKRKGAKLTPGTIYPTLKELHKKKFIKYTKDGRKKMYSLRNAGYAELERLYGQFAQYFWGLKHIISKKNLPENK